MRLKWAPPSFETYKPFVGAPPRHPATATTCWPPVPGLTATSVIMFPTTRLKFPPLGGPAGWSTGVQVVLDAVSKLYSPCDVAANSVLPSCAMRKITAPFNSDPPTWCQVD